MFTIRLDTLKFHAFHGVHEEERILGNNYEVNVELSFETDEDITELSQTINYVSVYQVIKQRMSIPTPLMETIVQDLVSQIHTLDDRIKSISVSIQKKNPPIRNIQGSVAVSYKKDF